MQPPTRLYSLPLHVVPPSKFVPSVALRNIQQVYNSDSEDEENTPNVDMSKINSLFYINKTFVLQNVFPITKLLRVQYVKLRLTEKLHFFFKFIQYTNCKTYSKTEFTVNN